MEKDVPIFGFETDFAGTLRCIPMCVRLKLDRCGIKLSLKQWNKFPSAERFQLVAEPCDTPSNVSSFKSFVRQLIARRTSGGVEEVPLDSAPVWADASAVPRRLSAYAAALGVIPPSAEQWSSLTPLQRFALFKLTRPGHDNDNFIPAMREFGLLQQ